MRQSTSLPSVVLALLLTASSGFPSLFPAGPTPIIQLMSMTELKADGGGYYFVNAYINNTNIKVLVDTGASFVALSFEDAEKAGFRPSTLEYNIPVATANGMATAARVKLNRVEIDNVRVDDVDAVVLPKGALKGTLLGMSFLSKLSSFKSEDGVLTLKN